MDVKETFEKQDTSVNNDWESEGGSTAPEQAQVSTPSSYEDIRSQEVAKAREQAHQAYLSLSTTGILDSYAL